MRQSHLPGIGLVTFLLAPGAHAESGPGVAQVQAAVETTPVPSSGDAADDAAIWVHPTDPALSLVIGTDKHSGLGLYDLDGSQHAFMEVGDLNNADVRYDFPLGGDLVDIVAAGNRSDQSLDVFRVDPVTRALIDVAAGPLLIGIDEAYGFCLYRSWISGKTYAIVNDKDGDVEQYELVDDGSGQVNAVLVRMLSVGGQTEGMVADDQYATLYIGEEAHGIWRYGAEPTDGADRVEVDTTDGPNLTADVEGLSIYHTGDGGGYLLASSQGDHSFAVYERVAPAGVPNAFLKSFQIVAGSVDGCEETDGIDVTSVALGGAFPQGLFVAQDGVNPGGNQNFKLVAWPAIANTGDPPLAIDTSWDPREGPGAAVGACCLAGGSCAALTAPACGARDGEYQGDGTTCGAARCEVPPQPPGPARSPSPGDGAGAVPVGALLGWSPGEGAESHDVYFGTDTTPDASEFQGNQGGTLFDPGRLLAGTTYHWRIDEVNAAGTTTGEIWSFTTDERVLALDFLSVSTFTTEHGAAFDIPKPLGTAAGDFLVMVVGKEKAGEVFTPADWDLVDEGNVGTNKARLEVFSRTAGPDEPATYTVTAAEDKKTFAAILRYCCADPQAPIDALAVAGGNDAAPTAPSVGTTVADAMVVRLFGAKDDDLALDPYPAGHEGRFALLGGDKVSGAGADTPQAAPGPTGPASFSLVVAKEWRALTLVLAPTGGGPPCPADIDGDLVVAVEDLIEVIAHWGETGGPADVNGDGSVSVDDLIAVIQSWGPCG